MHSQSQGIKTVANRVQVMVSFLKYTLPTYVAKDRWSTAQTCVYAVAMSGHRSMSTQYHAVSEIKVLVCAPLGCIYVQHCWNFAHRTFTVHSFIIKE